MRAFVAAVLVAPSLVASSMHTRPAPIAQIITHDNRTPAGTLTGGVLTIRLEAGEGEWHPERDSDPAIVVRAFAESGKPLSVPGPLIRVPEGTEIRAAIRNTFARGTLVIRGLSTRGTSAAANDTFESQLVRRAKCVSSLAFPERTTIPVHSRAFPPATSKHATPN